MNSRFNNSVSLGYDSAEDGSVTAIQSRPRAVNTLYCMEAERGDGLLVGATQRLLLMNPSRLQRVNSGSSAVQWHRRLAISYLDVSVRISNLKRAICADTNRTVGKTGVK